jgi:glucosamine kinase
VSIFLGIDGGGTKTTCVVGDETAVLGTTSGGASNVIRVGEEAAKAALQRTIREACMAAGIDLAQVEHTCIGVAGAGRPEIAASVRSMVAEIVSGDIEVVGDMVIALEAAFGSGPGVIVIAGTGSIAWGRDEDGDTARAGGWGFAISDEGSGHWIGRAAVAATMRAVDEGGETRLLGETLGAWQISTMDDLVRVANGMPSPDFAALLPAVLTAADAGDAVARAVLTEAGLELANLARIVIRCLFREAASIPVAMSGGVFRQSALVRQAFYNNLRAEYPQANVNATVVEPVKGALELARRYQGQRGS